jgi:hypothetical protein
MMKFARTLALVDLLKKQADILRRDGMTVEAMALIKEIRELRLLAELHSPSTGQLYRPSTAGRSLSAV